MTDRSMPAQLLTMPAMLLSACLLFFPATASSQENPQTLDFVHEVVPILKRNCVHCHAGREAEGDFSLNTRALVIESGFVDLDAPSDSHLLELVTSDDPAAQMPPSDRPRVSAQEIAVLRRWIAAGMPWNADFTFAIETYEPPLRPRTPDLPAPRDGRDHPIDRILDDYLVRRNLPRPQPVDDATFLRRVSLDLIGLLPSQEQLDAFLSDHDPDKRTRLIDALLADRLGYADHWLTFFNDLLRNDYSGTGFITKGRSQISKWLYASLLDNKPFDVMARELIAPPSAESQGYSDGIKWRGEVSAGQTLPIQFSQSISQSFLGINMKCASCHDSFIDRWTLSDAYGLAAIYADAPLELHRCDKPVGETAQAAWLFPELGQIDATAPREQRLQQLAELMTHPENGRFARTIVNRLWYHLMGRGIVHPLDAMQSEPWNEDLLDYLASDLVANQFNLQATLRRIATSAAYQSQSEAIDAKNAKEAYVYRGPRAKRMTAEQFLDSIWQLTGNAPDQFDAPVVRPRREPGAVAQDAPPAQTKTQLGNEPTPLVRASLLKNTALMKSLGRPLREQIVSMRPDVLTTLEAVDLANEPTLAASFAAGAKRLLVATDRDTDRLIESLFRSALSRSPSPQEQRLIRNMLGTQPTETAVQDVMWAVCMLPEFMLVR